ncbi:phosphate/phosphite/phosphonate ABC transporter substrate-binding protein [Deinococcus misasensis]|uniref:phosphate/phosphite/phosphonate ABC transporter substrate-binding protein n=1 Tax=Deinococcus misasensis TaxID=392413 RepID=UPI000A00D28D|nr:PhnD/SsuA/transferrin family substrate-binding protein [Deinococcus misasensis]
MSTSTRLRLVSLLGPGHQLHLQHLVSHFEANSSQLFENPSHLHWHIQHRQLASGQAQGGFICGLLGLHTPDLEFLAAPVPLDSRAEGKPVYFSEVIALRERSLQAKHLHAAHWAYNDPTSLSGFAAPLKWLTSTGNFTGTWTPSGSHLQSMEWVLAGQVDVAAIDSQVLWWALQHNPEWKKHLCSLLTLGPYPAPPFVVHCSLPEHQKKDLLQGLLELHHTPQGQQVLSDAGFSHHQPVHKSQYHSLFAFQTPENLLLTEGAR